MVTIAGTQSEASGYIHTACKSDEGEIQVFEARSRQDDLPPLS